jgi:hypothetical protein
MKQQAAVSPLTTSVRPFRPAAVIVLAMGAMLISVGALNGGTALGASAWDTLV